MPTNPCLSLEETTMMKKLAVPALMLAMAAFGCSSSTTPSGTGGSAGHATGGTGTGGTHLGGASGGGTSGGGTSGGGTSGGGTSGGGTSGGGTSGGGRAGGGTSGGGTSGGGTSGGGTSGGGTSGGGTSGGGHAGGGTSGGGTSGGGAGGSGIHVMTSCTVTAQDHTSVLSPADFCANLLANCPSATGYTDEATCEASYSTGTSVDKRNCQSYHLCWGVEGQGTTPGGGMQVPHCMHAQGAAPCANL
ncbi:MAG TPA: hypothetical protein VHD61_07260 [Lacunisphaera sp.]|nr:hypothetical protein [Lacunisphaera sp.]